MEMPLEPSRIPFQSVSSGQDISHAAGRCVNGTTILQKNLKIFINVESTDKIGPRRFISKHLEEIVHI